MQSRIDKAPPSPRAKGRKEENVGSPVVADPLSYMQALIAKDFEIEPLNTNNFREYKPVTYISIRVEHCVAWSFEHSYLLRNESVTFFMWSEDGQKSPPPQ